MGASTAGDRMTGIEQPLFRAQEGIRCSSCFYFKMAETMLAGNTVPYCRRRERMIGCNPTLFMCRDFGANDSEPVQARIDWRWKK